MRGHVAYLLYVLRHKWWVFVGCLKLRVPIHQALLHDWSKFLPCEWGPYVRLFYEPDGTPRRLRDASGAYNPAEQPEEFQRAWLHHQRLRHHWQAWVTLGDVRPVDSRGGTAPTAVPLRMPERFIREMIADWYGAGMAQARVGDPRPWYAANRDKMLLHPESRARVERLLGTVFGTGGKP
jgi:hypothetical protein